jgi:hypothetical protein
MTGPSSIHGAQVIRLKKANWTVTTHSQVLDRNSVQPSAMSRPRLRRLAGLPSGTWVSMLSASTLTA